jgi:hypothetical protein
VGNSESVGRLMPKQPMPCTRCLSPSEYKVKEPPYTSKWESMALYREGWHSTRDGDWYCGKCWNMGPSGTDPAERTDQEKDELAGLRWQYLKDPKFHYLVTEIVQAKYREHLDQITDLQSQLTAAQERERELTAGLRVALDDLLDIDHWGATRQKHQGALDKILNILKEDT